MVICYIPGSSAADRATCSTQALAPHRARRRGRRSRPRTVSGFANSTIYCRLPVMVAAPFPPSTLFHGSPVSRPHLDREGRVTSAGAERAEDGAGARRDGAARATGGGGGAAGRAPPPRLADPGRPPRRRAAAPLARRGARGGHGLPGRRG